MGREYTSSISRLICGRKDVNGPKVHLLLNNYFVHETVDKDSSEALGELLEKKVTIDNYC